MQNNDLALYNFELAKIKEEENEKNYTIIEINQKNYAIETNQVLEIIKIPELECPSNMPECILGFFEYRQNHIPVIDLREIFHQERITYDLNAKIIILNTEKSVISIICDDVCDILKLNKEKILPVPYQGKKEFFKGIFINNIDNPYVINIENLANFIETVPQTSVSENKSYIIDDESSREILKERKQFLKNIEQNIKTPVQLFDMGVSFVIDNFKYYINMASVKEFFKLNNTKITKVPSVPDFIVGLINIKGEYITILDIRKFYNDIKTTPKEKSTIIIINSEEFKLGILADEILESMNINFNEIIQNKLHKQEDDNFLEFVKDEEIYQIVDIEKLLQDDRLAIC